MAAPSASRATLATSGNRVREDRRPHELGHLTAVLLSGLILLHWRAGSGLGTGDDLRE
jgi:hypothetical protein